jgi:hypothetical protein
MDEDELVQNDNDNDAPTLKITDRRKFAADGTPLESDSVEGEDTKPEVETLNSEELKQPETESTTDTAAQEAPEAPTDTPERNIAQLPRDFSAFLEGMFLEAMLYLGAIPDPRTGETIEDLELAEYKIDLLGMLQSKTEGNLDTEEKERIEAILYQLRMIYLEKTKSINL